MQDLERCVAKKAGLASAERGLILALVGLGAVCAAYGLAPALRATAHAAASPAELPCCHKDSLRDECPLRSPS